MPKIFENFSFLKTKEGFPSSKGAKRGDARWRTFTGGWNNWQKPGGWTRGWLPGWCAAGFVVWQQLKKYRGLQENLAAARKHQATEQAAGEDAFARNLEKVRFLPADYWYPMAAETLGSSE